MATPPELSAIQEAALSRYAKEMLEKDKGDGSIWTTERETAHMEETRAAILNGEDPIDRINKMVSEYRLRLLEKTIPTASVRGPSL